MGWTCPHCGSEACMTECKTIAERDAEITSLRAALAAAEAGQAVLAEALELARNMVDSDMHPEEAQQVVDHATAVLAALPAKASTLLDVLAVAREIRRQDSPSEWWTLAPLWDAIARYDAEPGK